MEGRKTRSPDTGEVGDRRQRTMPNSPIFQFQSSCSIYLRLLSDTVETLPFSLYSISNFVMIIIDGGEDVSFIAKFLYNGPETHQEDV
jgi:hypothetical protein